jgi:hypothetical protein
MARAIVNALTTFLLFLCLAFISATTHYRNLSIEARACPRVNNTIPLASPRRQCADSASGSAGSRTLTRILEPFPAA